MISYPKSNNRGWSKKIYYIFCPDYEFRGIIPEAKDFVKKCSVRCYGVLNAPGFPELYNCDIGKGKQYPEKRQNNEIFNTIEECLAVYDKDKDFQEKWKVRAKEILQDEVNYTASEIVRQKLALNKRKNRLSEFNDLLGEPSEDIS